MKCSCIQAFVCRSMTLHDERGGFNQMLLDPCFCMRLLDEKGQRFDPMLWALYFRRL